MRQLQCLLVMVLCYGFLSMSSVSAVLFPDNSEPTTGTVSRVTLYRGQALITRKIDVAGDAGSQEVVVSDLPLTIIDGSLYAESSDKIEVRAIRFRQRAVGEEPREEVRKLDEAIATKKSAIILNQKKTELTQQKLAYLDQLQAFVAPTAQTELTKGVLNADTLKALTQFAFDQRTAVIEAQVDLGKEAESLNQDLDLLNRKRAELTANAQRTVNEAVLFVQKLDNAPQPLELNYLVSNCGWSPTYTIRGSDDREHVEVEYNALIQQMTGEAWDGVQLTLSTASPTLSASGPSLAPFAVNLVGSDQTPQAQAPVADGARLSVQYRDNRAQQMAANEQLGNVYNFVDKTNINWSINKMACLSQQIELANPMEALSAILSDGDAANAPSLSYQLASHVSIANRNDQQMVRIFRGELSSKFYHVATPLLSSYVYREAEVDNGSEFDFLAGPVTVYIDNRFVGRAEIPTVAQGETFVIGFGSDAQLRARRELVTKTEGIQGGNKEIKLEYRIQVENYKNMPVSVRVFDRLPFTNRPNDVRISLSDPSVALTPIQRTFAASVPRTYCGGTSTSTLTLPAKKRSRSLMPTRWITIEAFPSPMRPTTRPAFKSFSNWKDHARKNRNNPVKQVRRAMTPSVELGSGTQPGMTMRCAGDNETVMPAFE